MDPQKRAVGPLSANAITSFYRDLDEPLTLIDVAPLRSDEFRVRYTFVARAPRRCDGVAIVKTTQVWPAPIEWPAWNVSLGLAAAPA